MSSGVYRRLATRRNFLGLKLLHQSCSQVQPDIRRTCMLWGEHGWDDISDCGESNGKLMKELLRALPNAFLKLHYVLCLVFNDEGYAEEFGDSPLNLLWSGHWGYKGFKF